MSMASASSTPRRPFPDDYLLKYSEEHVHYELDHFFWLATGLGNGMQIGAPSQQAVVRINNILIEGFALHLRNAIDFFHPRNSSKPTDVIAADFLPTGMWEGIKPPISATLSTARTRADKEMAHLTTARLFGTPPEKQWDFSALNVELKELLRLMCTKALPFRLAANVMELAK